MQILWKRRIADTSDKNKKNIDAIVEATISMSEILKPKDLLEIIKSEDDDLDKVEPHTIDCEKLSLDVIMASCAKFNQVVEDYTKLMSTDSPYMTKFYMMKGLTNVFHLYHWLRKITPAFENIKVKRVLFSKHIQLLWSNVGDLFATIVE